MEIKKIIHVISISLLVTNAQRKTECIKNPLIIIEYKYSVRDNDKVLFQKGSSATDCSSFRSLLDDSLVQKRLTVNRYSD